MTETPVARAAFAPAWPYLYKASDGNGIIPRYGKVSVFNGDLTIDELKPLTESSPVPGRLLRRVGGCTFALSVPISFVLWLTAKITGEARILPDGAAQDFHTAVDFFGTLALIGAIIGIAGIVVDIFAWKKWGKSLAAAWDRYEDRLVVTKALPEDRRQPVNCLGQRLDGALELLAWNDPVARQLDDAARAAIARYFELPVTSDDAARVARSTVTDPTVQYIRSEYVDAVATEKASLQDADDAVSAVESYVAAAKAEAAEREIVDLAKSLTEAGS